MSERENVSAIMITFPDNNISNCITNRSRYGMTLRRGGNSISNCHFTIQYAELPTVSNYHGASVRIWPYTAGTTELNAFANCYFNAGEYVFYTYHDTSQSFTGANMRTTVSNSHYTFYTSNAFGVLFRPIWYGGIWYGICITTQCSVLFSDYTQMFPYLTAQSPSVAIAEASEIGFASQVFSHDHGYLVSLENLANGESIACSNSGNPLPAGKYKRVAAIVTDNPVNTYFIPGAIRFEYSHENGTCCKSGQIIRVSNDYSVNVNAEIGTTSVEMYISNTQHKFTAHGKDFYVAYIYLYNSGESDIGDLRLLKFDCDSPFASVYGFKQPANYASGTNQNIFNSITSGKQVF